MSFHVGTRHVGPDFAGDWDGVKEQAADRICWWAASLFVKTSSADRIGLL